MSNISFVISYQFGAIQGSLLVVNKRGINEVSCLSSMLIENCYGLCIIALSDECQIVVNSELIRESNKIAVTFSPTNIINRNISLFIPEKIKSEFNTDKIQFSMISLICLFILCIIIAQISCFCCNKIRTTKDPSCVVETKQTQLTNNENGNEDEQLNFIAKI